MIARLLLVLAALAFSLPGGGQRTPRIRWRDHTRLRRAARSPTGAEQPANGKAGDAEDERTHHTGITGGQGSFASRAISIAGASHSRGTGMPSLGGMLP